MTHVLFLFQGGYSFGEGTSLYAMARELPPDKYRVTIVNCLGVPEREVREQLRSIFDRFEYFTLGWKLPDGPLERLPRALRGLLPGMIALRSPLAARRIRRLKPDVIVLCGYAVFVALPGWYKRNVVDDLVEDFRRSGVPVALHDTSANVFNPIRKHVPKEWSTLVPRPPSWGEPVQPAQFYRLSPKERRQAPPVGRPKVLWCRSTVWARWEPEAYRLVERATMRALAALEPDVEVVVNRVTNGPELTHVVAPSWLEQNGSYEEYQEKLAELSLVLTPNADSTMASRAAALGVPVVVVRPTEEVLARTWTTPPTLFTRFERLPDEWEAVSLSDTEGDTRVLSELVARLPLLRARLARGLERLESLPNVDEVMRMLVAGQGAPLERDAERARVAAAGRVEISA